jgi:hypothetical protein
MTTITRTPFDGIDGHVLDGAELFVEDRFSARAKVAAEADRTVVVSIPDVPAGRLTGTSHALLHVFVEGRLRAALQQAGFSRVERRCEADGRVAYLVATK